MKQKAFFIIFKELSLKEIKTTFLEGESPTLKFLDVLYCRKQRVVRNGQHLTWENVNTGVQQGSILGTLLFLIYINNLSTGGSSNCKPFADNTSLFSVVNDI